jgi:hypothetical protein
MLLDHFVLDILLIDLIKAATNLGPSMNMTHIQTRFKSQHFYRRRYILKETKANHYSTPECVQSATKCIHYLPNDGVCGHNEVRFLGKSAI